MYYDFTFANTIMKLNDFAFSKIIMKTLVTPEKYI